MLFCRSCAPYGREPRARTIQRAGPQLPFHEARHAGGGESGKPQCRSAKMKLTVSTTPLAGVVLIVHVFFRRRTGFFLEPWNQRDFQAAGLNVSFVQEGHSRSNYRVIRGLHYQDMNAPMGKLVRCTPRRDLRCGRGPARRLADLRQVVRRGALGGQQTPDLHSSGIRPWIPGAEPCIRSAVQANRVLYTELGRDDRLERRRDRDQVAPWLIRYSRSATHRACACATTRERLYFEWMIRCCKARRISLSSAGLITHAENRTANSKGRYVHARGRRRGTAIAAREISD